MKNYLNPIFWEAGQICPNLKISFHNFSSGKAGFYFSNGTGGEWLLSKGYYIFTGAEFSKCKVSQNLVYLKDGETYFSMTKEQS